MYSVAFSSSKAHTKDAKKWLEMFENKSEDESAKDSDDCRVISDPQFESNRIKGEESDVPILMCMTFADRLLAEMLDDSGEYNKARAKKDIAKHFEVSAPNNNKNPNQKWATQPL
jgi:hypothetical protein